MAYLPVTLNHFRAINEWASKWNATVTLDTQTFALKVQVAGRYCLLGPRFFLVNSGKMAYTTQLVKDVTGFIGWLPYDVLSWDLSRDKLLAKNFFKKSDLRSPAVWDETKNILGSFVVKSKSGSFGYQVKGPYRGVAESNLINAAVSASEDTEKGFAEQFIEGTNLKVWFWGTKAIYAQHHTYSSVTGDGTLNIRDLVQAQLAKSGTISMSEEDQSNIDVALKFQQLLYTDVPSPGVTVWLDFRYGRRYVMNTMEAESDSDLNNLSAGLMTQIDQVGNTVGEEALRRFKNPVLFSVDGVVDSEGAIWWLEINSNPMLPPEGYSHIFASLFNLSERSTQ